MGVVQVTSREFRDNQATFFELADKGEQIIIHRRRKQAYVLTPIDDDAFVLSDDAMKRIEQSREQYKNGETIVFSTKEELEKYLDEI